MKNNLSKNHETFQHIFIYPLIIAILGGMKSHVAKHSNILSSIFFVLEKHFTRKLMFHFIICFVNFFSIDYKS